MESILKSLSLGLLLRSVFAGVFFIVSFNAVTPKLIPISNDNILTLGLPVALVAGMIVYGLHRSLMYPLLEYFFDTEKAKKILGNVPLISDNTIENLVDRWEAKAKHQDVVSKLSQRMEHITVWADYIHLQYTSSLCIFLGAVSSVIINDSHHALYWFLISLDIIFFFVALLFIVLEVITSLYFLICTASSLYLAMFFSVHPMSTNYTIYWPLVSLGLIFFSAAFISNWRLQRVQNYLKINKKYCYSPTLLKDCDIP